MLKALKSSPSNNIQLILFPFAGGNAHSFYSWSTRLNNVDVIVVDIPRSNSSQFKRMEPLANAIASTISTLEHKTTIFFGHSMGAVLAYEVAHILHHKNLNTPKIVIASGSAAPTHLKKKMLYCSSDRELKEHLLNIGGISHEAASNDEILSFFLPIIRHDLEIIETYQYKESPKLPIDLSVFWGIRDIDIYMALPWKDLFSKTAEIVQFDGDHFFINSRLDMVLAELDRLILRYRS